MDKTWKIPRILLPYILYTALLAAQIYSLFFWQAANESSLYYRILLISFGVYILCGLIMVGYQIFAKRSPRWRKVLLVAICVVVVVQIAILPTANIYSRTLPAWPPRGSVYQFPYMMPVVQLNEIGLFMSYYLDGKILHANAGDSPKDFDNGRLFMEDEFQFVETDYPILDASQVHRIVDEMGDVFYTMTTHGDPKRKIPGFRVMVYVGEPHGTYASYALLKDAETNWYLFPLDKMDELVGDLDE